MRSNNSIRSNLSKEDIIASIRMSISADQKGESTYIIVEGYDDVAFLRNKVPMKVSIYESFSGKNGVREIVEHFNSESVIGICDRDYDYDYNNFRVFHYDFCCLEMMLIAEDSVLEAVITEFYKANVAIGAFRFESLHDLTWLSILRKLNFEQSWEIRFSGLSMHNIIHHQKFSIDKAIKELEGLNPQFEETHKVHLTTVLAVCKEQYAMKDLLSLTQGHDYLRYFHAICANKPGPVFKFSVEVIASALRCSYRIDDFRRTKVYAAIQEYSNAHHTSFLV